MTLTLDAALNYTLIALLAMGVLLVAYDVYTSLRLRHDDYVAARPPARWGIRGLSPTVAVAVFLVGSGLLAAVTTERGAA